MRKAFTTVLFDMDGVLFDTMPIHEVSWAETAKQYNLQCRNEEFYLFEGQPGRETIRILYERSFHKSPSESLIKEIYTFKTNLFLRHTQIKVIPFIDQVLQQVKEMGLKMGVVTGSSQGASLNRLQKFFGNYFTKENIVTGEDVVRGKPYPDPYLLGMQRLNADAVDTVVIENAPLGVKSASTSGAYTIAICTGPIPACSLKREGANLVLKDMRDLLEWFVELNQNQI